MTSKFKRRVKLEVQICYVAVNNLFYEKFSESL